MPSSLGAPFHRLWSASLASNLADGLVGVTAPLLALRLTDDPFGVSAITAASFLPWLLFAIASGTVVDRHDRRRVMGAANTVRFLVASSVGLVVATHHASVWLLVAAVFVMGAMETLFDGGAQALVPAVTPAAHLDAANGRFEAGEMVMQGFVAMPIGAALFALSEPLPFALSALTFAGSAILAVTLPAAAARARRADAVGAQPVAAQPVAAQQVAAQQVVMTAGANASSVPFRAQLADGARYLWRHDRLRPLWIVSTLTAGTMAFAQGALIVYVVDGLGIGQAAVGAFTALAGVGGVLGAVLVGPLRARVGRPASMLVALVATGPLLVVFGAVPSSPLGRVLGCGAFALVAMFVMIWNTNAMTVRQRLIPSELLGRVNGTWRTVGWGLTPVATLLGGVVARSGLRLPLLIGGAVVLGIALVGLPAVRRATTLPDADADEHLAPAPVGTLDA